MTNHSHNHKYSNNHSNNHSNSKHINNNPFNDMNHDYHKKRFKKSVRALIVLFVFLAVIYLSLPHLAKLAGFTIQTESSSQVILTSNPQSNEKVYEYSHDCEHTIKKLLGGYYNNEQARI